MSNSTTWLEKMRAVTAGEYKRGEAEKLIETCAAIADEALDADRPRLEAEAKAEGKLDMTPAWGPSIQLVWQHSLGRGRKLGAKCPPFVMGMFERMGEVADKWLVNQKVAK